MHSSANRIDALLRHEGYVRALARRLVFDEELARDIEQETWLAALKNAPRASDSPRAWLARVVRSFAFKAFRARGRRDAHEQSLEPREVPSDPALLLEREDARRSLVQAVAALDEPWRSTLILHFFDELSPAEIARRAKLPVKTVYARLERGLELLRAKLERERGRERGAWALALVRGMQLEPLSTQALAAAAAKTIFQGALFMSVVQKIAIAAVAVVVLALSFLFWPHESSVESQASGVTLAAQPTPLPVPAKDAMEPESNSEREQAALPAAAPSTAPSPDSRFGSLLLHVVWADDKTPAAKIGVKIYQSAATDFYQDVLLVRTTADGSVLIDPILAGNLSLYFDRGGYASAKVEAGVRSDKTVEVPLGFDLEGHVRDADGRAVAGADVYVYQSMGDSYEGDVLAQSSEDGSYFVRSVGAGGLSFVSARAAARAPTNQKLVLSVAGAKVKCDIVFENLGGAVDGRVLALDGTPCIGAAVVIGGGDDNYKPITFADGSEGRTAASQRVFSDEQGRYRFDCVAEGAQQIQARAKGLAPWKGQVQVTAGRTTSFDMTLDAGASLAGVVHDESGAPVAGAHVHAGGKFGFRSAFRKAAQDGSFAFDGLPLGEFEASVETDKQGSASTTLFGVSGATLHWDATLMRGLVLRGRVVAPGREISGWYFNIQAPGSSEPFLASAQSDKNGRFELNGCPDVALRIEAHTPKGGHWPVAIVENVRAGAVEVVIEPDPLLEPSVKIQGRVLDSDGKPLGGAQLIPSRLGFNTSPILASELQTGRIDLGPYPPGTWSIRIMSPGYASYVTERRTLVAGESWSLGDLVLQRGGLVIANIRRETGVEGSKASLMVTGEEGVPDWLAREGDSARSGPLAPGRYTLSISGDDIAVATQTLEVRSGEETRVEVVLRSGTAVKVRIVDASGRSLGEGVKCEIRDAHGLLLDADLLARFGPIEWSGRLLAGSYRFIARHADGRTGEVDVQVGDAGAAEMIERELAIR